MILDELERLAKPYRFRGKAYSVRTLHTALEHAAKVRNAGYAFSAERDAIVLRNRAGDTIRFPRTITATGLSIVEERDR